MSGLQMSMYIWSIGGTGICLWALKQIRDVSHCLGVDSKLGKPNQIGLVRLFFRSGLSHQYSVHSALRINLDPNRL